jgi:hypothetical protein
LVPNSEGPSKTPKFCDKKQKTIEMTHVFWNPQLYNKEPFAMLREREREREP